MIPCSTNNSNDYDKHREDHHSDGQTEHTTRYKCTTQHRAKKTHGLNTHWSNHALGDRKETPLGQITPNGTREAKPDTLPSGQALSK